MVVTLEQAVAAPLCTARLRQAGARVIKVERSGGDFARQYDTAAQGESTYFTWLNQGKESIVLDIKQDDDQALLRRLIAQADVFVQNMSPGALKRLDLDSDALRADNPDLITCDISGYGDSVKVAHLRAYDLLVQAEAGLISVSGGPGELGRIGISLCDIGAGATAYSAILEALIGRLKSGAGKSIKLSLFDVAAEWMMVPFIHQAYGDGSPQREGLQHPSIAPYGAYQTEDGVLTLISIQNEREWKRLCADVLKDESLATDPRFCNNETRVANRNELNQHMLDRLSGVDSTEFRQRLALSRIAFGGVNTVEDLTRHLALRTQAYCNSMGMSMSLPAHPYGEPLNLRTPIVGEHTDAIKAEFLSF